MLQTVRKEEIRPYLL